MTPAAFTGPARRLSARNWWILAALAAVACLGMGWDWYFNAYYGTQTYLTPGSSVVLADGTIEYTPGLLAFFPTFAYDSGVIPGYASHARVLLPLAALAFVLAVRRRSRSLARTGLAVAAIAPLLAGGLTQGSAIFLVGLWCAAMALRAAGLIDLSRKVSRPRA